MRQKAQMDNATARHNLRVRVTSPPGPPSKSFDMMKCCFGARKRAATATRYYYVVTAYQRV